MNPGTKRAIVVLFILSFLLSAASCLTAVTAVQGEIKGRASTVALCEAGNEARGQQVTLWTHIIAISAPPPHQTPAQKAQREQVIRQFIAYVRQVFAPRDCSGKFSG